MSLYQREHLPTPAYKEYCDRGTGKLSADILYEQIAGAYRRNPELIPGEKIFARMCACGLQGDNTIMFGLCCVHTIAFLRHFIDMNHMGAWSDKKLIEELCVLLEAYKGGVKTFRVPIPLPPPHSAFLHHRPQLGINPSLMQSPYQWHPIGANPIADSDIYGSDPSHRKINWFERPSMMVHSMPRMTHMPDMPHFSMAKEA